MKNECYLSYLTFDNYLPVSRTERQACDPASAKLIAHVALRTDLSMSKQWASLYCTRSGRNPTFFALCVGLTARAWCSNFCTPFPFSWLHHWYRCLGADANFLCMCMRMGQKEGKTIDLASFAGLEEKACYTDCSRMRKIIASRKTIRKISWMNNYTDKEYKFITLKSYTELYSASSRIPQVCEYMYQSVADPGGDSQGTTDPPFQSIAMWI